MTRRTRSIVAAILAVIALGGFATWWFLLRSDAPPPVSLEDAVDTVTTSSPAPTTTDPGQPAGTTTSPSDPVAGEWTVTTGSFAGYRVEEELANVGFTTAAGRSERVTGRLTIAAGAVTVVEVTVDVTALRSDSDRRDQAIQTQALETRDFPTAKFALAEPIVLPAAAADGESFSLPASGDLTIHGVTNRVTITLEAQLVGDLIVVVGSTPIRFAAYGIAPPEAMVVLSVEDHGIMEFQLVFSRS